MEPWDIVKVALAPLLGPGLDHHNHIIMDHGSGLEEWIVECGTSKTKRVGTIREREWKEEVFDKKTRRARERLRDKAGDRDERVDEGS